MARSRKQGPRGAPSQLRIIGGQWRGRKLEFLPAEGLRPTGDRIRETLFNWLAGDIAGARCLDLFAGSGALGLEALSRGAGHCDFVDSAGPVAAQINAHLTLLDAADRGRDHALTAMDFLRGAQPAYHIVFIDPPFDRGLVPDCCRELEQRGLLAPGALVYVETARDEPAPEVPGNWHLHRDKRTGNVAYRLYRAA